MRIAILVSSALILVGVALSVYFLVVSNGGDVIKIELEAGKDGEVVFDDLCMVPGEETGYTLELMYKGKADCKIKLDFNERAAGTLKNYAYVRIEAGGEVIYEKLLADALAEEAFDFPYELKEGEPQTIDIIYYMPESVGNEAADAEADFELLITVSDE